jgi:acyl dehydratase
MTIDPARIANIPAYSEVVSYTTEQARLYALAVGAGSDPMDEGDLAYVDPARPLKVLPSMAVVLSPGATPTFDALAINHPELMLHAEQRLIIYKPLKSSGKMIVEDKIGAVYDRGAERGAVIEYQVSGRYDGDSDLCFTNTMVTAARGDGGFGGTPPDPANKARAIPERDPDVELECITRPEQALWYSLTGDTNPIHISPRLAKKIGFERPILHGLCSYGMICRVLIQHFADGDPDRLRQFDVRFSAPVTPGDTLKISVWREDANHIAFRVKSAATGQKLIDNGYGVFS